MKLIFIVLVLANIGYLVLQEFPGGAPHEIVDTPRAPVQAADGNALVFVEIAPGISSAGITSNPAPRPEAGPEVGPMPTEVGSGAAVAVPEQSVAVAVAAGAALPDAASPPSSCVIAGPFRKQREADALIKQLADAGISAVRQPRDAQLLPDYMVYVGPEPSARDARALVARFKARKKDAQLIAKGALRNALSLGVFSRAPLARSLQTELLGEGFKASIETITRNRPGYQVRAALPQLIQNRLVAADTPMTGCPGDAPVPAATSVAAAS